MRTHVVAFGLAAALVLSSAGVGAQTASFEFEGLRVCAKCHDQQGDEWRTTIHAKAFESLRPKVKAEDKIKAKLDPDRDYTEDKDCLGCHTTGYGRPGGYRPGMTPSDAKALLGVGCESCHGAGSRYRQEHGEAEHKLKRSAETTERKVLLAAGQTFDYEAACAACHLNYQGSPWAGAKPPFSPFTPTVDPKYAFDFAKALKATGAKQGVHTHFKLKNVFKGEPVPKIRADIQKNAKELDE